MRSFPLPLVTPALLLLAVATTTHAQPDPEPKPTYRLEEVRGGLYRFTAGHYHSVVLVTAKSVVVTDPLNAPAATWLRAEIARRFQKPIRYVIYSHSHPDHAYGGEVYGESGAVFVAHEHTRDTLVRTRAQTRLPEVVFERRLSLHVDGQRIDLRYHGPNNGQGSISMHFQTQKVLHVVDWIVVGRLPYRDLKGYDLLGSIRSIDQVLSLDFEVFVGGHAKIGTKADVRRAQRYLETLLSEVLAGIRAGKPLATIQEEADLSAFEDLAQYEAWRALNIAGAYRALVDDAYLLMRPEVPQPSEAPR